MKKLAIIFVTMFLFASLAVATAPTIDPINDQSVFVGESFSYQVVADDADNDTLTYQLTQSPAGMAVSASGLITWNPTISISQTVTVSVSDGNESATESFTMTSQPSNPEVTLSDSSLKFGDDDTDRGNTFSQIVTITNTGSQDLTNLQATLISNTGTTLNSDFEGQVVLGVTSLVVGQSTTATVSLKIPLDQDSREVNIGRLSVSAQGATPTTATANLVMEAKSYLRIKDAEIDIEGDDENLDDGDTLDNVKEGDEVKITLTIENLYSDNDNIEIEDVYFEIESDEDDWDIDEESDEVDIKEDDDEDLDVTFTIDDDLDEDETEVTIRVFGNDEEGNFEHYDELTFTFEIDRERDEVTITSTSFNKPSYTCSDSYAELEVRIKNTGTDDQEEVVIQVQAEELDWHSRERDIEIDEDDSETFEFRIPLTGVDETDEFFVDIEVYDDDDEVSDEETEVITVSCSSSNTGSNTGSSNTGSNTNTGSSSSGTDDSSTVVVVTPPTTTGNTGNTANTGSTGNVVYGEPVGVLDGVRTSNLYVVLLIALIVLVLIGIVLLGTKLLRD